MKPLAIVAAFFVLPATFWSGEDAGRCWVVRRERAPETDCGALRTDDTGPLAVRPHVSTTALQVSGELPSAVIDAVVRSAGSLMLACGSRKEVAVRFIVDAHGVVESAAVEGEQAYGSACAPSVLATLSFPSGTGKTRVRMVLQFE